VANATYLPRVACGGSTVWQRLGRTYLFHFITHAFVLPPSFLLQPRDPWKDILGASPERLGPRPTAVLRAVGGFTCGRTLPAVLLPPPGTTGLCARHHGIFLGYTHHPPILHADATAFPTLGPLQLLHSMLRILPAWHLSIQRTNTLARPRWDTTTTALREGALPPPWFFGRFVHDLHTTGLLIPFNTFSY